VQFDRFPKEKGILGELAVISRIQPGVGIILLRRNAVIWLDCNAPYWSSKIDRSKRSYRPDPGLEDRAIALARTIDQLLIGAK
jgi:hypothetical protein